MEGYGMGQQIDLESLGKKDRSQNKKAETSKQFRKKCHSGKEIA